MGEMADSQAQLWLFSIGSTLLISAVPFLILGFIPIQGNTNKDSSLLRILLAFGAGGLLGDAFLHLIPHASQSPRPEPSNTNSHFHSHIHSTVHGGEDEDHGYLHYMLPGIWVLSGIFTFLIVDKFIRVLRGEDQQSPCLRGGKSVQRIHPEKEVEENQPASHQELESTTRTISVEAYLNIAADFMHNFTDGLAIGVSFVTGPKIGLVTMIAVLFHEIPHEIGDFAILVQSGYSKRKAMFIQLLTAVGALAGCIISLISVKAHAVAEAAEQIWMLPFTAGGFLYIAMVGIIPELLKKSTLWLSAGEVTAGLIGVFIMYLIALYE